MQEFPRPDEPPQTAGRQGHSVGAIDVAGDVTETPEQVAALIAEATKYVAKDMIIASTNCGMAPMRRDVAEAKMVALAKGAALARQLYA